MGMAPERDNADRFTSVDSRAGRQDTKARDTAFYGKPGRRVPGEPSRVPLACGRPPHADARG